MSGVYYTKDPFNFAWVIIPGTLFWQVKRTAGYWILLLGGVGGMLADERPYPDMFINSPASALTLTPQVNRQYQEKGRPLQRKVPPP